MIKLYGSKTSPYARRLRLLLSDHPYELVECDLFSDEGRKKVTAVNPIAKIPFLEAEDRIIFDSRNIYEYLVSKKLFPALSWDELNQLAVIDGLNDTLIHILLLKRSDVILSPQSFLGKSYKARIENTLTYLEALLKQGAFSNWNYLSICLFSVLDWAEFRELLKLESPYLELRRFLLTSRDLPQAKLTDPRN